MAKIIFKKIVSLAFVGADDACGGMDYHCGIWLLGLFVD